MKPAGGGSALREADFATVCAAPLFAGLLPEAIRDLTAGALVQDFGQDTLIFSAGDPADAFFIVLNGSVKLFILGHDGTDTIIDIVEKGLSFAEAAMFASASYPVNCEVLREARLLRIGRIDFLQHLQKRPQLALQILASLGQWQLHLMGELHQLKARTPAQRLAWFLVRLCETKAGGATVRFPFAKSIVASRIGITPESLSRALVRLAKLGVTTRSDEVTIADLDRLRTFCKE